MNSQLSVVLADSMGTTGQAIIRAIVGATMAPGSACTIPCAPRCGGLDHQSVQTTQIPGGRGYASGKQVTGRKRQLVVATMGLLVVVVVTAASVSDPAGARVLFQRLGGTGEKLRRSWVDGTYRGTLLEWVIAQCWFLLQPVLRSDDQHGFVVLAWRWVVERTVGWLTPCWRLSRDYEALPARSEAMISIAMSRLMIRRLAAT